MRNFYKVLGVSEDASHDEIKDSYLKLVKQWHPDRNPYDPLSNEMMKMYNEAYEVLSDPQKKHAYDKSIGVAPPETDRYHEDGAYEHNYAYSGTDVNVPEGDPLSDIKSSSRADFNVARHGPFMSRLLSPAYDRYDVLLATVIASVFLYLSVTYQERFFTPLFFLAMGVGAFLAVYTIIKIALIVLEAIKEDK